jgi:hypothetical protein
VSTPYKRSTAFPHQIKTPPTLSSQKLRLHGSYIMRQFTKIMSMITLQHGIRAFACSAISALVSDLTCPVPPSAPLNYRGSNMTNTATDRSPEKQPAREFACIPAPPPPLKRRKLQKEQLFHSGTTSCFSNSEVNTKDPMKGRN